MEQAIAGRQLLEATIASLDVGVVVEDADRRVLVSNPAADRILGDGAVPIHEDGWPLAEDELPAALALRRGRDCAGITFGLKAIDGSVTWVLANAHPLFDDEAGAPWGVATSYVDVTDARGARDDERRGAERFRSLIEHSSDVITILDEQGRQTYESPSVERALGYAPDEFDGASRLSQIHPEDASAVLAAVTGLIGRPGASTSAEYRIRARDGSWRIVESVATNRLHDPAVLGVVVNTRDVTERRREQAALRATTSRLTNLVQNMKSGVLVTDEERRIVLVNSELCAIFGIAAAPDLLAGSDSVPMVEHLKQRLADPATFLGRIDELMAARRPVTGEEVEFADGRTVERDYIPIAENGTGRGNLWLYRDISERKKAEREVSRARDEAIRASRLKSDFLATMSHEIRTPMNGVIGTVELLLDTALSSDQRELAAVVRDSANGLLALIDDALDLSKIEAEKLEPKEVDFELAAVVEGVADVFLSSARRKGLWLTSFVDPRAGARLRGDAQWLRQVLLNLLGNAVKFTDHGEVHVRAELADEDAQSATVRFAVRDDGPGIPPSARERLFEPFAQLDSGHGGTGLGLAICQRLVALMGGDIEVESTPGAGATFAFTLRFPRAAAAASEPPPTRHRPSSPAAGTRVLVAEDNEVNRALIVRQLAKLGITADAVTNGRAAIDAAGAHGYDVVLMDCQMPGIDGLEAARTIRSRERGGRRTAIVAVTAGVAAGEVDRCLAAGMDACLNKPFSSAQLADALARVLPPQPAAPPPLDLDAIERLRADVGDDDALRRITSLFADGLEEARSELAYALQAGDADAVRRVAHRLRSSSATFGAKRLAELSRRLETNASADAHALIGAVERESRSVGEAIGRLDL